MRKLMPALYHLDAEDRLPDDGRILALARSAIGRDEYRQRIEESVRAHVAKEDFDPGVWQRFSDRIHYASVDAARAETYGPIADFAAGRQDVVRVFYLATAPDLFGPIARHLSERQCLSPLTRIVLEKPLGHDLASSQEINLALAQVVNERQIYRIDHYLGKETVQNLMALRFANSLFEPLWNRTHIDHVQITVAETVGVGSRWGYYDKAGALRDMVQNHLLQLLCLTTMEPPISLDGDDVRNEKVKVLKSLTPVAGAEIGTIVRGQYRSGAIDGEKVPGYLEEQGASATSSTETFVALKCFIDNWRWAGVPFYLRSGKRLAQRSSDIVVQFRSPPHVLYPESAGRIEPNKLIMRLQPNEGIRLTMVNKQPGPGEIRLSSAPLNLSFAETFGGRARDAYERLLLDVIRGRPTLFMRSDELEAAWRWADHILDAWKEYDVGVKPYAAGSWGPSAAIALIERDGRTWYEEEV
jgi:glucose-6-phosphate 1-dehydrogenase